MRSRIAFIAVAILLFAVAAAAKKKEKKQYARLNFLVVSQESGKPIRNAAVVLHPVLKNGDQSLGGMELKSETDGTTTIGGIPYGTLRVQVIAPHKQTFGQDYKIDQPEMQITIKLQDPKPQYSVY